MLSNYLLIASLLSRISFLIILSVDEEGKSEVSQWIPLPLEKEIEPMARS